MFNYIYNIEILLKSNLNENNSHLNLTELYFFITYVYANIFALNI